MNIKDFTEKYSTDCSHSMEELCRKWEIEESVDKFLNTSVSTGVVLGDVLTSDKLLDQISPELLDGFHKLMGDEANTYDEVREILLENLEKGDSSVLGIINKIKGQIGENQFIEEISKQGFSARLAESGSQEAWDVAIDNVGGSTQYIQVKMYNDSNRVIDSIIEVNEKLENGLITDADNVVRTIDFAVPKDIYSEVSYKVSELDLNTKIYPIDMTAEDAANIVDSGFDNVGPEALENFFGELLGASLTIAALHAIANGFLLYKGAKSLDEFLIDTLADTSISTGAVAAGIGVELILNNIALIGGIPTIALSLCTTIIARQLLYRFVNRFEYVEWLEEQNSHLADRIEDWQLIPV